MKYSIIIKIYLPLFLLLVIQAVGQEVVDTTKFIIKKGQVSDYYIPIVQHYMVRGKIVDENQKPLNEALVMIKQSPISTHTDEQGLFELQIAKNEDSIIFQIYYPNKEILEKGIAGGDSILQAQLVPKKRYSSIAHTEKSTQWYDPANYNPKTFCNPLNISYAFEYYNNNSKQGNSFRSSADPLVQPYKGEYYLFSSNQSGFFVSKDLLKWDFFYSPFQRKPDDDDQCAPASLVLKDTMFYIGSTYRDLPIWYSTHPKSGKWKHYNSSMLLPHWDPALFEDNDGKVYLYYGSSNEFPLKGVEIDRKTFEPIGIIKNIISLYPETHGWERFGMNNDDTTTLKPFTEGAFMTKYNNKYYLQYGAPGTEFKTYADGVYVSDSPLTGFKYQKFNPFCYKPGGFVQGTGHGGTFQDYQGSFWHIATCMLSLKYKFERRIGLYPTGFDNEGTLYSFTAFGDYPLLVNGISNPQKHFSGWMLLSYNKKMTASSTDNEYVASNASDENMRTYWSAATANPKEWLMMDLGDTMNVHAIQTNFYEHHAYQYGKAADIYHQYQIYASDDAKNWILVVDKSNNDKDEPHDYVELSQSLKTRFLKIENVHMPAGKFAIMDFRVFGKKNGVAPSLVQQFKVKRDSKDSRNAMITWKPTSDAYGYNIYYGIAPDKLYHCITVYNSSSYDLRGLDKDTIYYFAIEALGETGVSSKTKTIKN